MNERLRQEKTTLLVQVNPEFMKKCQKLSEESGRDLNEVMNEILKIGEGVVKAIVEDGDTEIRIKCQEGAIRIEGYKGGNGHQPRPLAG